MPNVDEISFKKPVKINLIRIVRPKVNLYQKITEVPNITITQYPIKKLDIFFKNY